jgi:hypothetical protein
MKFRHAVAAALLPAILTSHASAVGYDFENLPLGPLTFPQDIWTAGGSIAVIESGAGVNTSHVLDSRNDLGPMYTVLRGAAAPGFGFPNPNPGDRILFAADFRIPESPRTTEARFALGMSTNPTTASHSPGSLGINFHYSTDFAFDRLLAQRFDGAAFAGSPVNFIHNHGDWYHAELVVDLTGPSALASFFIQNLTSGTPLAPIPQVQNYNLGLVSSAVANFQWNTVYVEVGNVQLDNLQITTIPEPASATILLAATTTMLLARRRRT